MALYVCRTNGPFTSSGFNVQGLKPPPWVGGESEALSRLERHLERKAWVASFGKPKMTPQSLLVSLLTHYQHFKVTFK